MAIKTTLLETSKLLKEAGFKKECHFGFVDGELECNPSPAEWPIYAPTSDELLEELPKQLVIIKGETLYTVRWNEKHDNPFRHESLPEALAQMWLYLKKENLI